MSSSQRSWVKDFIITQDKSTRAHILKLLKLLSNNPHFGPPLTKKIKSNLYELRVVRQNQIRILYTVKSGRIVLLHALIKKTHRLNKKDIQTAQNRIDL